MREVAEPVAATVEAVAATAETSTEVAHTSAGIVGCRVVAVMDPSAIDRVRGKEC